MQSGDSVFAGSIPALYDRYLGPALFEPYAADLARRVADLAAGNVLETAAGTGRVTRALARVLPDSVSIVATDLNQAMLDFASAQPGAAPITWQRADAAALPFEDSRFDAVVCQFGAMFFTDKPVAYREALRVLKPAGRFLFSVWDAIEVNEFAQPDRHRRRGAVPGRVPRRCDRDGRTGEPIAGGARSGDRLLSGDAIAQRDRRTAAWRAGGGDRGGGARYRGSPGRGADQRQHAGLCHCR